MIPLADLLLFTALGFILVGFERTGRRLAPTAGLAILLFAAFFPPLLHFGRVHWLATLVLALGIALQSARLAARSDSLVRRLQRLALPLAAAVPVLIAGSLTYQKMSEAARLSELSETPPEAPDVLLIILDTVRASSLSMYGYARPTTPGLERLAERSLVFDAAWSTAPWTLPAHASLFTGRYAHELSTDWEVPLDDRDPVLAERFAERGYRTAGFSANLIYATWESGLERGFHHFEDYPVSLAALASSSLAMRTVTEPLRRLLGPRTLRIRPSADRVVDRFLRWERGDDRPYFAFLNLMDAHAPYLPPDELAAEFGPLRTWAAPSGFTDRRFWSEEEIAAERAAYDGGIAFMDDQISRLLQSLEQRGKLDRTLVIVTSDHGEQFGEHGLMDHGNSVYRPLLHVPLLFHWPQRIAAARVERPVSFRDVAGTIAGAALGDPSGFPGSTLLAGPDDSAPVSPVVSKANRGIREPEWVPIMRGDMHSLVDGSLHYIRNGDGVEELYDLVTDPQEEVNLALDADRGPDLEEMRRRLAEVSR